MLWLFACPLLPQQIKCLPRRARIFRIFYKLRHESNLAYKLQRTLVIYTFAYCFQQLMVNLKSFFFLLSLSDS